MKQRLLVLFILLSALFLRVCRADQLTGFYYDQGRDAEVIWNLWHSHKFFLIGPTTGIEGIFLGPFYYYLITPFYLLGNGNPVAAVVGLALINVLGIYIIYKIGREYFLPASGWLAALFIAFSLQLVQDHRWLSNPTPLPFFAALAVYLLLKTVSGSKNIWHWLFLGLALGLGLQLEAASAVFFLPAAALIFIIYRHDIRWEITCFLGLIGGLFLTLVPQLIFNFRHNNILFTAFERFLVTQKSFSPAVSGFFTQRLDFYFTSFSQKLFLDRPLAVFFSLLLLLFIITIYKNLPRKPLTILLIWLFTPMVLLLFYHGNYGYVWSYYFTGVYSVFMLLVAVILSSTYTYSYLLFKKGTVGLFIAAFLVTNIFHLSNYLSAGTDGETAVMLGPSLAAVDWVYDNAGDKPFNVDVYVPPVIPYAYDYLFLWQGVTRYHRQPSAGMEPLLYTLYEVDPPHPERLGAWLDRQAAIARPAESVRFGGVTVDRRLRI
jgi:4-amino-4-deoxy-L-arabinose transferase-like glycosyltransferase